MVIKGLCDGSLGALAKSTQGTWEKYPLRKLPRDREMYPGITIGVPSSPGKAKPRKIITDFEKLDLALAELEARKKNWKAEERESAKRQERSNQVVDFLTNQGKINT